MKNHWLDRKKARVGEAASHITVHHAAPEHLSVLPQTITVGPAFGAPPQIITVDPGYNMPPSMITVDWDMPPVISCTVTVNCPTPYIGDGIQFDASLLPKEINVSSFNQGIC